MLLVVLGKFSKGKGILAAGSSCLLRRAMFIFVILLFKFGSTRGTPHFPLKHGHIVTLAIIRLNLMGLVAHY